MLEKKLMTTFNYVGLSTSNFSTFSNEYALLIQSIGAELDSFTLVRQPHVLSIYLIALYLLSYSEFFVFPQPRSNATTTVTFLTSSFSL